MVFEYLDAEVDNTWLIKFRYMCKFHRRDVVDVQGYEGLGHFAESLLMQDDDYIMIVSKIVEPIDILWH